MTGGCITQVLELCTPCRFVTKISHHLPSRRSVERRGETGMSMSPPMGMELPNEDLGG